MKIRLLQLLFLSAIQIANCQSVPAYIPQNGLQGFWPFDNNANDVSGNNNHGTPNGVVPTTDRFNNPNKAYSFNGFSDFISTNMTGILGNNSRAVSFWAKTTQSVSVMSCVAWGDEQYFPNNGVRFECGFNPFTGGPAIIGSDCSITYSGTANTFSNDWHHYVYQFNGGDLSQVQIYQDGILLTQNLYGFHPNTILNTSNNWKVHFGKIPYVLPHFFEGALDEAGIWDRVLTPCEIWELYNSSKFTVNVTTTSSVICLGQNTTLNANGASSYTWMPGNQTNTSIVVAPAINTTYTLTGTNGLCTNTNTFQLQVIDCASSVKELDVNSNITLKPNPFKEYILITENNGETILDLTLQNINGEILHEMNCVNSSLIQLNTETIPSGIYIIRIKTNESTIFKRLIK